MGWTGRTAVVEKAVVLEEVKGQRWCGG